MVTIVERTFVVQPIDGQNLAPLRFEKEVLRVEGNATLAMVRKRLPARATRGALVLTHGFGQNRYAWHLPHRSMVNALAAAGWDVFNLDLRGHGRSRSFGSRASHDFDAYVEHDLPRAIEAACTRSGVARVTLVGHSLGGLVSYATAPHLGTRVGAVITLGAPYSFGAGNAVLRELARVLLATTSTFARSAHVPMRFVQGWFRQFRGFWDHPDLPLPLRAWHPRSLEPELLEDYLRLAFDVATLGELVHTTATARGGRFASADGRTDYADAWERCDLATLVVAGSHDLLAPVASVRPAYDRSHAHDRTLHILPMGHADLILGRDAPRSTWPIVLDWLDRRCAKLAG
jgi:pimeloyl-ACP methyl ester carboxylesterase